MRYYTHGEIVEKMLRLMRFDVYFKRILKINCVHIETITCTIKTVTCNSQTYCSITGDINTCDIIEQYFLSVSCHHQNYILFDLIYPNKFFRIRISQYLYAFNVLFNELRDRAVCHRII